MNGVRRLVGLAALLCIATAGAESPPVPTISAEQLLAREAARDPALVVLDVRTPAEFAAGHVPGAINVPHDQVADRLGEFAGLRDKDLVVYCGMGRRAALALEVLAKNGYTRLHHLDGDMQGWVAAGRPVEKLPAAVTPAPKP